MSNASTPSLLVVGSIAFDDLEMPHGTYENVVGGAATYSAAAASLLAPVRLVGIVGKDFPDETLAKLRARGVDTAGVEHASGKTFRWRGRYSHDLQSRVSLDTQLNVFADFRPKLPDTFAESPYVLLGNIHPALQIEVLERMRRPKFVIADTMNFWITGEPKLLGDMLKRVDRLVINDEEARELSGKHNLRAAAAEIRKRGPKQLIIKRGEHGALLFEEEGMFFVPAFPLEDVRDPTGAGDSFAGGLAAYLASHDDIGSKTLRRAMFCASAMGSFCVEDVGTAKLFSLTRAELSGRLAAFMAMVDYGGALPLKD